MEFKIHSWTDWTSGEMKMAIMRDNPANSRSGIYTIYNLHTGETLTLEVGKKVPEAFTITIPWLIGPDIKKAFAEWIYGEGIKPEDVIKKQGTVEGELSATKYHLEDLRHLLKLNKREDSNPPNKK